jgi:NAD(P)-dependent dehydrogenase (short-subunit alcohol dehydrogenase family)
MSTDAETFLLSNMPRYRWTCDDAAKGVDLTGKVIVITGATNGIGIPTATALARTGARIIITARDPQRGKDALDKVKQDSGNPNVEVLAMDLVSFKSIEKFAADFLALNVPLYALVHNAGIMAVPFSKTEDGFESQIQVNFLSVALLTRLLVPRMGPGSRVVVVSSIAHKRLHGVVADIPAAINWDDEAKYDKWVAYAVAKGAVIQFCNEANRRFQKNGITFNSLHPGGIMTGLQKSLPREEMVALGWVDAEGNVCNPGFKTIEQGGSTTVWATVSSELEGRGGLYLENCAVTDPSILEANPMLIRARGTVPVVWDTTQAATLWNLMEQKLGAPFAPTVVSTL